MTEHSLEILPALEQPGQPDVIFTALDHVTKSVVGHQLFTLLYVDGDEVARVYSNRPAEYAVSGRKPMGKTPWGDLVLKSCKPYLGRDKQGVRWAFFDHALIESMGLGSVITYPVVYDGACLWHHEPARRRTSLPPRACRAYRGARPAAHPGFLEAGRGA